MVRWMMSWAEDRATLGSDPSADPEVETGGRAVMTPPVSPCSPASGIDTKAINPSRCSREQLERENDPVPGDGIPGAQNSDPATLQFRLNHYKREVPGVRTSRAAAPPTRGCWWPCGCSRPSKAWATGATWTGCAESMTAIVGSVAA